MSYVKSNGASPDLVVVGAGVAGLTAAALAADAGASVLVLERHNVAGGCASFYQRAGYRFDVGATLVGGFGPRGIHRRIFAALGVDLAPRAVAPAMIVHLPDRTVARYGDGRWHGERRRAFGDDAEPFWRAQEHLADLAWDFARTAPGLPVDAANVAALARALRPRHLGLLGALGRTVATLLPAAPNRALRAFVDAQLLITAQAGADEADLAYGVTALDLAREGTFHLPGGVGDIAIALARAVRRAGSAVRYGAAVEGIEVRGGKVRAIELAGGERIACDRIVAAIPAADLLRIAPGLARSQPRYADRVRALPERFGAFMLYVGLPPGVVPDDLAEHHQLVADYGEPLGEGNSTFLSFSAPGETGRARNGGRAVTISTHTDVARWERARQTGTEGSYRDALAGRLLAALDRVVPGASRRAEIVEPATPHTFARFTGRHRGLVGGMPQTRPLANLHALSHRTPAHGLFLAGDTAFPGQSTVGASLSGVAAVRAALGIEPRLDFR